MSLRIKLLIQILYIFIYTNNNIIYILAVTRGFNCAVMKNWMMLLRYALIQGISSHSKFYQSWLSSYGNIYEVTNIHTHTHTNFQTKMVVKTEPITY